MRDFMLPKRRRSPNQNELSAGELADFLLQLSEIHGSPVYGNVALSVALKDLASAVRRQGIPATGEKRRVQDSEQTPEDLERLRGLTSDEVKRFINDDSRNKSELLALAVSRFSIPTSQLKRMRVDEVRSAIMSALLHESSIEIISNEAEREGAKRSS